MDLTLLCPTTHMPSLLQGFRDSSHLSGQASTLIYPWLWAALLLTVDFPLQPGPLHLLTRSIALLTTPSSARLARSSF